MSNEKYATPEMDIIEFGNEDVCTDSLGVNVGKWDGSSGDNYGIGGSTSPWDGSEFES